MRANPLKAHCDREMSQYKETRFLEQEMVKKQEQTLEKHIFSCDDESLTTSCIQESTHRNYSLTLKRFLLSSALP